MQDMAEGVLRFATAGVTRLQISLPIWASVQMALRLTASTTMETMSLEIVVGQLGINRQETNQTQGTDNEQSQNTTNAS